MNTTEIDIPNRVRELLSGIFDGKSYQWKDNPAVVAEIVRLYLKSKLSIPQFEEATDLRHGLLKRFLDGLTSTGSAWGDLVDLLPPHGEEEETSDKDAPLRGFDPLEGAWRSLPEVKAIQAEIKKASRGGKRIQWKDHSTLVRRIMDVWKKMPKGTAFWTFCTTIGTHASSLRRVLGSKMPPPKKGYPRAKTKKVTKKVAVKKAGKKTPAKAPTKAPDSAKPIKPAESQPGVLSLRPGSKLVLQGSILYVLIDGDHSLYESLVQEHMPGFSRK